MQPKLIISFEHYSEPDFLLRVEEISTSLNPNVHFPLPWPAEILSPADITAAVTSYKGVYNEASNGDRAKIKIRNTARVTLTGQLKKVAPYLEIVADGDVAKLGTTGYELRHDIVRTQIASVLGALQDFKVTRSIQSGALIAHAKAEPHADMYQVQTASSDPSIEANWSPAGEFVHCNRIEISGLTPNKTYYVRIRPFNKHGYGVWTTSPGIVVV